MTSPPPPPPPQNAARTQLGWLQRGWKIGQDLALSLINRAG